MTCSECKKLVDWFGYPMCMDTLSEKGFGFDPTKGTMDDCPLKGGDSDG